MKKHTFFLIVAIMVILTAGLKLQESNNEIVLSPVYSYELPDKIYGFTCTGLSKAADGTWWLGNFGKELPDSNEQYPSLVNVSNDFKYINYELARPTSENIQGVAFDAKTNTIWFSNGEAILNVGLTGELISSFQVPNGNVAPNGVAYNKFDDSLWVLCYEEYLYNFTKTGELIDSFDMDYPDQDHICFDENGDLWFSYGADYLGENNYVCKYDIIRGG